MILRALYKLEITLNGNKRLSTVSLRCKPLIHNPSIGYPAAGTFSISIRPLAPTNRISAAGATSLIAFAMATAGKICPPVPPPLRITRMLSDCSIFCFSWFFLGFFNLVHFFTHAQYYSDGDTGKPDACSTHAH